MDEFPEYDMPAGSSLSLTSSVTIFTGDAALAERPKNLLKRRRVLEEAGNGLKSSYVAL